MAVEILLPGLASSTEKARISRWLAGDGEQVTEGQPLFAIEAGGTTKEVEAPATGVLKISASADAHYDAGTVLGYIE